MCPKNMEEEMEMAYINSRGLQEMAYIKSSQILFVFPKITNSKIVSLGFYKVYSCDNLYPTPSN